MLIARGIGTLLMLSVVATSAAGKELSARLDRQRYLPGEPILMAVVYSPSMNQPGVRLAPPLSPQAGFLSMSLTDVGSGRALRSTAAQVDRLGRAAPESLGHDEGAIECLNLLQWFAKPDSATPAISACLGLSALPIGRYKVRLELEVPWHADATKRRQRTVVEFQVIDEPLQAQDQARVEEFIAGCPGANATGKEKEQYCQRMFTRLAPTRFGLFTYYHAAGLMGEIPLKDALAAASAGSGADVRCAHVLLQRAKLVPMSPQEMAELVRQYTDRSEPRLVIMVARQIGRARGL